MFIHVKPRASITHARVKIDVLSNKGYQLIGSLPPMASIWHSIKLGVFLFKKEEHYYQCKSAFLFLEHSAEEIETCFNEQNEPLPDQPFSRIFISSYIFLILNNGLFLLRQDAHKSGHNFLAGPHAEDVLVGGELYFEKGNLLLANNKSSNYPTSGGEALTALINVWGLSIQDMFSHVIEQEQVEFELACRRVDSANSHRLSGSSATLFANQPVMTPMPPMPQPSKVQGCLPCTIL